QDAGGLLLGAYRRGDFGEVHSADRLKPLEEVEFEGRAQQFECGGPEADNPQEISIPDGYIAAAGHYSPSVTQDRGAASSMMTGPYPARTSANAVTRRA